ncbi:type-1 angiotensin II receptor A-like [Symsagittifera roscoffensis]|uniref:type-1 angiotensin II receptor A-like n=1 Tax=Symsagittifera roscoffensis TaxID=84072 RepID=UPI00307C1233
MNTTTVEEEDLAALAEELHGGYYTGIIVVRAVTFAIAIIGITGNVLAYMTASRLDSKTSGTTYIKCLAVADTAAVFQDGILEMGLPIFGLDVRTVNRYVCKGIAWYSWTTTIGGNYVLTMFTLDRLTALWLPVMYREKSKPIIAITLSLLAEAFAAGVCWPTLFLFDINGQVCEIFNFDYFSEEQMVLFANLAMFLFMLSIPFATILISNSLIIYKLRQNKKDGGGGSSLQQKKEREITMQLLTVSIAFMITNAGVSIAVFATTVMNVDTPEKFAIRDFVNFFKELPAVSNNSMNFFLYVLSSQHFRTQFLTMIGRKRQTQKPAAAVTAK